MGEGKSIHQACKEAGITAVTYYRWRKEYGGHDAFEPLVLPLQFLQPPGLVTLQADLSVEKAILKDTPREASKPPAA